MKNIAQAVQEGAAAYLKRQFRTLGGLRRGRVLRPAGAAGRRRGVRIGRSVFFLVGAGFSATVGYLGMWLAVRANVRVAAAANETGRDPAMRIAFRTGGMVGMLTVGLGLLGASVVVLLFKGEAPHVLEGFGFGAALLAMFMRVGGGIFTKAADVGADLVGKVEQNIPEDDPRNAATIADNVGDNVGDCAGMAADLFESYAVTLVAALILGSQAFGDKGLVFPLLVPAIGALTAVLGVYLCKPRGRRERPDDDQPRLLHLRGASPRWRASIAAFVYLPTQLRRLRQRPARSTSARLPEGNPRADRVGRRAHRHRAGGRHPGPDRLLHRHRVPPGQGRRQDLADRRGHRHPVRPLGRLRVGGLHRAGDRRRRVRRLPARRRLGDGLAVRGGAGRLRPADHGRRHRRDGHLRPGLRQRPGHRGDVRRRQPRAARRSSPSSTRSATPPRRSPRASRSRRPCWPRRRCSARTPTRSLEALAEANAEPPTRPRLLDFCVFNPAVLVGLLLGAAVVFLFSGLAINAVGRAAGAVVFEVRRQFREIPGIMEGTGRPEYGKVVDIFTRDSLRELITPGILAVLAPDRGGLRPRRPALAGFLAGAIGTGTLMAVFLANSGGAWDNAKKLVEDGNHGGKGSLAHEATIIGDTVGDPFKDTAGPAINPLIKVMNLVSLLIASAVVSMGVGEDQNDALRIVIAGRGGRDHRRRGLHLQAARGLHRQRRPGTPAPPAPVSDPTPDPAGPADRLSSSAPTTGAGPTVVGPAPSSARGLAAADFTYDAVAGPARDPRPRGARPQRDDARPAGVRRRRVATRHPDPAVPAPDRRPRRRTPSARCPALVDLLADRLRRSLGRRGAALLDIRPYAADDERPVGRQRPDARPRRRPVRVVTDHVLGISPAADLAGPAHAARARRPRPRPRHRVRRPGPAPGRARRPVVATDVNARALWLGRFNAALNEVARRRRPRRAASSSRWRRRCST